MPIYSYRCDKCHNEFEMLVGVTSEKKNLQCTKCGSAEVKKILSTFSVGSSNSESSTCSTGTCPTGTCPTCY